MSNIHTIKDFEKPNNEEFPVPSSTWVAPKNGQTLSGAANRSDGNSKSLIPKKPSERRTGAQLDDTYWSWNLPPGKPYEWYHIILNCFAPCFIGPICSKVRRIDFGMLFAQSLFWIFWIDVIYFIVEISIPPHLIPLDFFSAFYPTTFFNNNQVLKITGAKYAHDIYYGHVWRLITPIFMHGGIMHIFMNMFVQLYMGLGFERNWWFFRMIPIYFLSGIFGNIVSCLILPNSISVGASGALLGMLFAKFPNVVCRWQTILPYEKIAHCASMMTIFIFFVLSFFMQNVDWSAHLGGAVMGFLVGWVVFANYFPKWYCKVISIILPLILIIGLFVGCLLTLYLLPASYYPVI